MSEFTYTCPACKTTYFLSAASEKPWFNACPKCGHRVSGQVTVSTEIIEQQRREIERLTAERDAAQAKAEKAEAEVKRLKDLLAFREDGLVSYAEIYEKVAGLLGFRDDANPSSEMDSLILHKIVEYQELIQKQEDLLNRILQPGERWIELHGQYRAAGEYGVEWLGDHGEFLGLAEQRLKEAIRDTLKEMVKR